MIGDRRGTDYRQPTMRLMIAPTPSVASARIADSVPASGRAYGLCAARRTSSSALAVDEVRPHRGMRARCRRRLRIGDRGGANPADRPLCQLRLRARLEVGFDHKEYSDLCECQGFDFAQRRSWRRSLCFLAHWME
jgi:hypothetical protein